MARLRTGKPTGRPKKESKKESTAPTDDQSASIQLPDWKARKEVAWEKLTKLGESKNPRPALVRLWQSQIESCDKEIKLEEERQVKALQDRINELTTPVPPVPASDVETERRVNKMLEELEQLGTVPVPEVPPAVPPLYVRDLAGNLRLNVKRTEPKSEPIEQKPSTEELKKAADKAEKKLTDDKKAQRIAELKEAQNEILKGRHGRDFMTAAVHNPTFLRDGNLALKNIARELDVLEGRSPTKSQRHFDPEAADRRRAAEEEEDFMNRLLEGERISNENRAIPARPAPISGGQGMCEGPEWNR